MVIACELLSLFILGYELNCSQPGRDPQSSDPPPVSSPTTPSETTAAEVDRLFANWPYEVMTCKVAAAPKRQADPSTVTPDSEVRSGPDELPDHVRFEMSVDIGLDDAKWEEWSKLAAAGLKRISTRQSSSQWSLSQTTAPRVDAKSGFGSEFLKRLESEMSPEVRRLEHRLFTGLMKRANTQSKDKRKPGGKPSMQEVNIDALGPLLQQVKAFVGAGWGYGKGLEEVSACISIQAKDGAAVQHFLLPAGCQPRFWGLAPDDFKNERVPVVELILKDKDGIRLPVYWGDKQAPSAKYVHKTTNILLQEDHNWYFATPRFLVVDASYPPSFAVSSPAITFRLCFDLDQEVASRLASAEVRLIPGRLALAPPGPEPKVPTISAPPAPPPPPTKTVPQLPNATPPGLSAPAVPQKPSGPRVPRMPGPPPAVPR